MRSKYESPKGMYHDRMITKDGLIKDFGRRSNIIVDSCHVFIAALMKAQKKTIGINFMQVGKGKPSWDNIIVPAKRTDKGLADNDPKEVKINPKKMVFIDAEGNITADPTRQIQVEVTLKPGVPPVEDGETSYPMREFGLFGKIGKQEYMLNYVRHPVINKREKDTLIRTIKLIF